VGAVLRTWPVTVSSAIMLKWLWMAVVVVLLDQLTKYIATDQLVYQQPVELITGFNFTLMHNYGAAFSLFSEHSGWQRWFFSIIAIGVSIGIVVWIRRLPPEHKLTAISLSLILGGAIGNVWDRLTLGYVIDFVDVYYSAGSCFIGFYKLGSECHWPAFNIADSAISVGAVLLIFDSIRTARAEHKASSEQS
jgi:signal peptidase II